MKARQLILFLLITVLGIVACRLAMPAVEIEEPTTEPAPVPPIETATEEPAPTPSPAPSAAELIPIDDDWNLYVNRRLGFSLKVPTSMYRHDADCYWREDGDSSYRPREGTVPVEIFEGEDTVYITSEYVTVLTEPTQIPSGGGYRTRFAGCERLENSVTMLAERDYTSYIWEIAIRPIDGEADLERLIDDYYGECFSMGEIQPMEGKPYATVRIVGDEKPVEESECLLRGGYVFLYSQELRLAATWGTGQMIHFSSEGPNQEGRDSEMRTSFEFLPREGGQ